MDATISTGMNISSVGVGGPRGPKGDRGDRGDTGSPGPANTISIGTVIKGEEAEATITGDAPNQTLNLVLPKGDRGNTGATGATGPVNTLTIGTVEKGADATATITGTAPNQTLNLTLPRGDKGDTGPANTLSIGTVQSGSTAAATITGTSPNQTLNLVLPKGEKGDKGDTGNTGPANTLSIGTVEGGATAGATITGNSPNQTLNLTLPKGDTGLAATITVGTVTTGAAGSSATVTNSGTASAAVLDFTIPKGDKGDAGPGSGDMLASDYDPNNSVKSAGGIVAYVGASIPTVNDATLTITQNGVSKGTFTSNDADNTTIALTDTTYSVFTGADASTAGTTGLVPAPAAGDEGKYLAGDGTWKTVASYTLPIAGASTLGGIKVGTNLSIAGDGTLSADAQPAILYSGTGQNTDGAMTQKAVSDIIGDVETILTTLTTGTGV